MFYHLENIIRQEDAKQHRDNCKHEHGRTKERYVEKRTLIKVFLEVQGNLGEDFSWFYYLRTMIYTQL